MFNLCRWIGLWCLVGPGSAIDGDTFRMGHRSVRLWGIDAPELHEAGGPAAKEALSLLLQDKTLTCVPKGRSYERIVARCKIEGRDLGELLTRTGTVLDCPSYSGGIYNRYETPLARLKLKPKPYC